MPPHSSRELASQPQSMNMPSAYCDRFGLRIAKGLLPESSRSPPGKLDSRAAMLLDRVTELAMGWIKKWVHLWQKFSRALMKAVLMGIAKGACRLAAAVPLGKAESPLGEKELGRGEFKMDDRGALSCKMNNQVDLILSSLEGWPQEDVESLIECPEQLFSGAKMGSVDLEDNTALHLICHSISVDFESDSDSSSNEDMEWEGAECPGRFPQKTSEGLDIRGYFEASCSPHEEFGDFDSDLEGDSRECAESLFVSQERRESVRRSEDLVMFEEESVESTSDSSEDWEHLSQCGKAKENLGTPTGSYGFSSPLVLSLFYCPSEEDDDDDDSEDWSSEDEMEETGQAYLHGAVLENGASSSAAEDNTLYQDFPENFCGSIQSAAFTPPEPKKRKEVTVSFHLRKPDSKTEEFWNPPKPSSPKDQSPATGHPTHHCCQRETESNHDLVTTETFQKGSQIVKKVRFAPEVTVHTLVVWDYASRAARRGPWEEMARDRCRFQRRIAEVGAILAPCLETEHRAKAWQKIHGALELVRLENTEDTLHSSDEREKMSLSKKL